MKLSSCIPFFLKRREKRVAFFLFGFDEALEKLNGRVTATHDRPQKEIIFDDGLRVTTLDSHDPRKWLIWSNKASEACAVFFLVDAANRDGVTEARAKLEAFRSMKGMSCVPMAILGAKFNDSDHVFSEHELLYELGLNEIIKRPRTPWYELDSQLNPLQSLELFMCSFVDHKKDQSELAEALYWIAKYCEKM